jgi:Ca-activated chloride channel homolog
MEFEWPASLWLLLVVAALVAVYVAMQLRRRRYALRYSSLALVREAVGPGPGVKRHIPPALFLLAFVALVVALARPAALVKVPGLEGTVILAIDVSGSMLATDVKPSRMEAAKTAAKLFVERQQQARNRVRVGLVSFSDNAQLLVAPTLDRGAVADAIDRLKPQRATAIGRAILVSLDALFEGAGAAPVNPEDQVGAPAQPSRTPPPAGTFASSAIVLLTDGENNQSPPPLFVVDDAAKYGVRVYTVGVGTPEGAIVTNEGRSIRSELDETTLKKIAEATQAKYFNAQTEADLVQIYDALATELVVRDERSEITVAFAGAAAALFLLSGCLAMLWFNRLP